MQNSYETPLITRLTIAFSIITLLFSTLVIQNTEKVTKAIENQPVCNVYIVTERDHILEDSREPFAEDSEYYRMTHQEAQEPHVVTENENLSIYISDLCASYHVDENIVRNLIYTESRWNPNAVSVSGEHLGLMQVSSKWQAERAKRLGVTNLMDPYSNILVGVDLLAHTLKETGGDYAWSLMIYNEGYQSAYQKHTQGIVSSYARTIMQI